MNTYKGYKAVVPISAYPFHLGHVDLYFRAEQIFGFEKVLLLLCNNSAKTYPAYDRMEYFKERQKDFKAAYYDGLVCDFCNMHGINFIVRGCKGVLDYEYEKQLSDFNSRAGLQTIIMPADKHVEHISSTIIREYLKYGKLQEAVDICPDGMRPYLIKLMKYLQGE